MSSEVLGYLQNHKYVVGGAVVASLVLCKLMRRKPVYNDPADTVIVCGMGRGPAAPSLSPYPMKLETYLRINKIPYKAVSDRGMSPKGKIPWMIYNGQVISDSQFCIEFLNKKFDIDMDKDLTPEQKAVSVAFRRLIEDSLYWCAVSERWIHGDTAFLKQTLAGLMPSWMFWIVRRKIQKQAYDQGMGRHTREEALKIGMDNFQALSDYLGKKEYFMGNKVTEVDCTLFSFLAQFKYHFPGSPLEKAVTDYPNLDAFVLRMKDNFWPDWADCITHGGNKRAIN